MQLSDRALKRASELGLTREDVLDMVRHSARYQHPVGNIRFMDFWFLIRKGDIDLLGEIGSKSSGVKISFPDAINCTHCWGTMLTVDVQQDGSEILMPCRRMGNRELGLCDRS